MPLNPEYEFSHELSCIRNENIRNVIIKALYKFPDYFWDVPASSSGAHHPKTSLGRAGLVRHVKSVFAIAESLLTHPTLYAELSEDEKDEVRAAIILHDSCKQGYGVEPTHTMHTHPLLPRQHLRPDDVDWELWDRICVLIESHMGPWTKDSKGESDIVLPEPETTAQKLVHLCDYLASRKDIEVDVFNRVPQQNYSKPEKKATENQLTYIAQLYKKAKDRNVPLGNLGAVKVMEDGEVKITMKEASALIDKLKELLN